MQWLRHSARPLGAIVSSGAVTALQHQRAERCAPQPCSSHAEKGTRILLCDVRTDTQKIMNRVQRIIAGFPESNSPMATAFPKQQDLAQLCGRVTKGSSDSDFATLSHAGLEGAPFVFVIGNDGIQRFLEMDARSAMTGLGFEHWWIDEKLEEGKRFTLILFPARNAQPATWDGVFNLVSQNFNEPIPSKVLAQADNLRSMSFWDIELQAQKELLNGETYAAVERTSTCGWSEDARYIDDVRLAAPKCSGTIAEVRAWLYNRLCLSELYDGSGWTKDEHTGELVVREYLVRNRLLEEFEIFISIPLRVRPGTDAELRARGA